MRYTKKVTMWPVGLIGRYGVSSPVLGANGTVVDFFDAASVGRMFAVDMAAFAVNVEFFLQVRSLEIGYVCSDLSQLLPAE